jgi:hypothetical protein
MRIFFILSAIILICISSSFTQKIPTGEKRITQLEDSINALRSDYDNLQGYFWELYRDYNDFKSQHESDLNPVFDPAEVHAFQPLRDRFITVLVSIERVEKFLDGYNVVFNFGNLTSAKVSGFDLTVKWGSGVPKDFKEYFKWQKSLQTKVCSLTDILLPGEWIPISVNLVPAPQQDFRYIKIQLKTNIIGLHKKQ